MVGCNCGVSVGAVGISIPAAGVVAVALTPLTPRFAKKSLVDCRLGMAVGATGTSLIGSLLPMPPNDPAFAGPLPAQEAPPLLTRRPAVKAPLTSFGCAQRGMEADGQCSFAPVNADPPPSPSARARPQRNPSLLSPVSLPALFLGMSSNSSNGRTR